MNTNPIHSCSLYCERPECIKAQRDEMRDALAAPQPAQPIGLMSRALIVTSSGAGYKQVGFRFSELHDAEQIRLWALSCGAQLAPTEAAPQPAQPAQEAVAVDWTKEHPAVNDFVHWLNKRRGQAVAEVFHDIVHCYRLAITHGTTPQPQRQPLTDEQAAAVVGNVADVGGGIRILRATEQAHGITKGPAA